MESAGAAQRYPISGLRHAVEDGWRLQNAATSAVRLRSSVARLEERRVIMIALLSVVHVVDEGAQLFVAVRR